MIRYIDRQYIFSQIRKIVNEMIENQFFVSSNQFKLIKTL